MTVANIPAFSEPVTVVEGVDTYTFDYNVELATEVQVQVTDNGVVSYLTYGDDYTVVKADAPAVGGTITVTAELTVGAEVVSFRQTGLAQDTSLPNQGPYFAKTVEEALDRITMLAQEAARDSALALQYPVGSTAITLFPAPVENKAVVGRMVSGALQYVADGPSLDELNTSVSAAAASAAAASTSETNAGNSETAAAGSATAAADSATAALNAASLAQVIVEADGALMDYELADETAIKTLQAPDNTTISTFGATLVEAATKEAANAILAVPAVSDENRIINGSFSIWQRGTSHTGNGYKSTDRWYTATSGGSVAFARQSHTVGDTFGVNSPRYFARLGASGHSGASDYALLRQAIEGVRTYEGQTITLLGWAKRASGSGDLYAEFIQQMGTGGSPSAGVTVAGAQVALTTSWAPFAITVDLPSISGKTLGSNSDDSLWLQIWATGGSDYDSRTDSLGNQTIEIDLWGIHIRLGEHTTDACDEYFAPSEAQELEDCRRYARWLPPLQGSMDEANSVLACGFGTALDGMRSTPTSTVVNATNKVHRPGSATYDISSIYTFSSDGYIFIVPSTLFGAEKPGGLLGDAIFLDAEM